MSGIPAIAGIGMKLLGFGGAVKSVAAKIPPKVWYAIAILAALVAAFFIHQHHAHKALKAADVAGYNRRATEDAAALKVLLARAREAGANGAKIAQEERTKNETENSNIRTAADALSVRGPGAARCRPVGNSAVPAASGGSGAASRPANAADGGLPVADGESDLAAVPWRWLVSNSEERDLDRAEVLAWRDWYAREAAEWDKLKAPLKPSK